MAAVRDMGCTMEQVSGGRSVPRRDGLRRCWGAAATALATSIKNRLREQIGLPAPTDCQHKLVPKSQFYRRQTGWIDRGAPQVTSQISRAAANRQLWGVGKKGAAKLQALGIYSIGDLQNARWPATSRNLASGARSATAGAPAQAATWSKPDHEQKSISRETTFARDVGSAGSGWNS